MLTRKKVFEILKRKYPYLRRNFGVKRIGLFGSFAKGQERKTSDVDLFVEFNRPIGLEFITFADYIETSLSKRVDILTPEGIKGIRLKKVARDIKRNIIYV